MAVDPRDTYAWKVARRKALRGATHCAICERWLDFAAPPCSRWSPSVDHITPLSLGGAPFDQSNLRVVHYGCNASRGNGRRGVRAAPPVLVRANWW